MKYIYKAAITIPAVLLFYQLSPLNGQIRYLESVFQEVLVEEDIVYGSNYTIVGLIQNPPVERPVLQDLLLDLYYPAGDMATGRPLVLLVHDGNLLPFPVNLSVNGTRKDSLLVELANQLARRGFVVASMDYRLGWNPVDPSQEVREFSLVNALYRAVQDVRTSIRFFRKSVIDEGNPYGIDPEKIILLGPGSGGVIANTAATLDREAELQIPPLSVQGIPMVQPAVNGDLYGTSLGLVSSDHPFFTAGDTLCIPNWPTYANGDSISSDHALTVNLSGILIDTSWIDERSGPWISFHHVHDRYPFAVGYMPPFPQPLISHAYGSYMIHHAQDRFQNHAVWEDTVFSDPVSLVAQAANQQPVNYHSDTLPGLVDAKGLFPLRGNEITPWDWWSLDNPNAPDGKDPDKDLALLYIDTILQFTIPRACIALEMNCNQEVAVIQEGVISNAQVELTVFPNPSSGSFFFQAEGESPILSIQLFDLNGRLVQHIEGLRHPQYSLQRGNLPAGTYIAQIRFEEGVVAQRLILK